MSSTDETAEAGTRDYWAERAAARLSDTGETAAPTTTNRIELNDHPLGIVLTPAAPLSTPKEEPYPSDAARDYDLRESADDAGLLLMLAAAPLPTEDRDTATNQEDDNG